MRLTQGIYMMIPNRYSGHAGHLFFYSLFLLLASLIIGFPRTGSGGQVVTVGIYENAPKVFTDESGTPAGLFIDIIENIARKEDWELKYVPGTWSEGLDRLETGRIDLMPDVAYTSDREKIFAFHAEPVLSSWFQVYAPKNSGIKSILDLAGKRIAVLERSVQQEAFARMADGFDLNITLVSLPDYQTLFEQVAQGTADAAVTNRFYGVMHAKKFNLEDTAIIFHPTNLFFASSRKIKKNLLGAIDNHLLLMKENPGSIYYQSLKRWTSETISFALPAWVRITGIVIGLLLLISLTGSFLLKQQVNARTRDLQKINREMEMRIEARTAELATAMEKARAADHLKSAFLATMSHELRTPLNSIIGFTGILLQGLAGPLNEEQKKQLGMVQASSRHLLALINDVLDISKIEAGQLTLSLSNFDLRPVIEKTINLVSPLAVKKRLDLKQEINTDVATIYSDQRRVEQIILNLLNNALKFTEQGTVTLSCRDDNNHYRLSVSDTGIGIPPEEIPGLFTPFHQIDTGLSRKREGTGLGLSICKKLISMLDGTIDVQSIPDQGSTFTIRIPKFSGGLS